MLSRCSAAYLIGDDAELPERIDSQLEFVKSLRAAEMEYKYAVRQKKPIMAFFHGDPGSIASRHTDPDPALRKQLESFRARVERNKVVKYWTDAKELPGYVAQSLLHLRRKFPAIGWVRGDQAITPETQLEISELKREVERLQNELAAEQRPRKPVVELAEGSDKVILTLAAAFHSRTTYRPVPIRVTSQEIPTTWDEIFVAIAPLLLQDTEENEINIALYDFLRPKIDRDLDALEANASEDEELRVDVTEDTLRLVLLQLRALDYVQKGTGHRDDGRYWALTDNGYEHLLRLRAIRKK